jgi:hypothetical protein
MPRYLQIDHRTWERTCPRCGADVDWWANAYRVATNKPTAQRDWRLSRKMKERRERVRDRYIRERRRFEREERENGCEYDGSATAMSE